MDLGPQVGFLVLADISGFTAFVTSTELEHGAELTGLLLETVMNRLSPPLDIQELEGDAVFAIGIDRALPDAAQLPGVLARAFTAFKAEQRRLAEEDSCACGACRSVGALDLKLIAHYGRFVRQSVGGRERVAGSDVVLVHRLLKNPVRREAYVLLTSAALERVSLDPTASGMRRQLMRYPYFGDVLCFVADLDAPWHRAFPHATVAVA